MDTKLFLELVSKLAGSGRVAALIYYFADHIVKHDVVIFEEVKNYSVYSKAVSFYMFLIGGPRKIKEWSLYEKYQNFREEVKQEGSSRD